MYRQLAESADDPVVRNEMLELAMVCDYRESSERWVAGLGGRCSVSTAFPSYLGFALSGLVRPDQLAVRLKQ
jgi:hypothetical protein